MRLHMELAVSAIRFQSFPRLPPDSIKKVIAMHTPVKMLIINPGSTSTKVSYFADEQNVYTESIFHDAPELMQYPTTNDQLPMRKQVILDFLRSHGMTPADMDVFVGRGGCAFSQKSGVMEISEQLVLDTAADKGGSDHPAKLGVMLAYALGTEYAKPAYTAVSYTHLTLPTKA